MQKQILIVDDDEDDRDLFCDAVMQVDSSIVCTTSNNGEEALTLLKSTVGYKPDYIFLDINMPVLDGMQCLAELRKSKEFRHIPVIIYTTAKREEDREETKRLDAVHFITKPSSLVELCQEITYVISTNWRKAN